MLLSVLGVACSAGSCAKRTGKTSCPSMLLGSNPDTGGGGGHCPHPYPRIAGLLSLAKRYHITSKAGSGRIQPVHNAVEAGAPGSGWVAGAQAGPPAGLPVHKRASSGKLAG